MDGTETSVPNAKSGKQNKPKHHSLNLINYERTKDLAHEKKRINDNVKERIKYKYTK